MTQQTAQKHLPDDDRSNKHRAHAPHQTNFDRPVYAIFGLPFDAISLQQTINQIRAASRQGRCFFSTPNLNGLIASYRDAAFRESVLCNDLSIADGMPLIWLARLTGLPIRERVAGSDLFDALMQQPGPEMKVYFFGGPEGAAARASQNLNAGTGPLRCVGFASPGFGSIEQLSTPQIIDHINQSGADVLILALSTVKGHAWIMHNLPALEVPVISHLGAVINFVAGTISRAPDQIAQHGFEWLWRIKEEPVLWRRYWHDGVALLRLMALRVLPWMLLRLRHRFDRHVAVDLHVAEQTMPDGQMLTRIRLSGTWSSADLASLRSALQKLNESSRPVEIDASNIVWCDGAFIGLLMLLWGHQKKSGKSLRIVGASSKLQKIFRLNCADFLLD